VATAVQVSPSSWRGKRARQYLFPFPDGWNKTQGGPRHGEAVVVVGFDRHDAGFEVAYVRSYAPGGGRARRAYEWLKAQHGRLTASEVVDTGMAFHERMLAAGLLCEFQTGDGHLVRLQQPTDPSSSKEPAMTRQSASIKAQSALFTKHLCSRIFSDNGYGSTEALIAAIRKAAAIPEDEWRNRKAAFNEVGETAPMRDDGFLLKYEDVPAFLATETAAFQKTLAAAATGDMPLRLEAIHVSADGKVGISTITFAEGSPHDSTCDWGPEYPEAQTANVTLLLYGEDDRLLDRALIDGDTWREIEDQTSSEDFYAAVFHNQSISQALQERTEHAPSI